MHKQQGMTTLGILCVLAVVGLLAFAAFKVVPAYLEMTKVYTILDDIERDYSGKPDTDVAKLRTQIGKRINIESIYGVKRDDFQIKRTSEGYEVSINHPNETHYLGNLYLVVKYDKTVVVRK